MAVKKDEIDNLKIFWSKEDKAFVAKSRNYPQCAGVADTQAEAIEILYKHIEAWKKAEKAGKAKTPGRPKKDNLKLNINVKRQTKVNIEKIAYNNDKKLGAIVDEIVDFYLKHHLEEKLDKLKKS